MEVFKFGGASVKDADGIKNLSLILKKNIGKQLLVVISAMGKTTNALEKLTKSYFDKKDDVFDILDEIKTYHFSILDQLFENKNAKVFDELNNTFVEIEWIIEDEPQDEFNFIYDQIVSIGEILSTKIVSHYLNTVGINNKWLDARSYIQTDNTYREAKINWEKTEKLIAQGIPPILKEQMAITQGFIGNTSENFTTTLGREGSDYTASIFASCLNASQVTVWKDVPGILNADPKLFKDTQKLDELSYAEAIEMTYYGATVIHPKTIKPLQNKGIPLFVKPFMQPEEAGTIIKEADIAIRIPILIVKQNQLLLSISTKDFSFMTEHHLKDLFAAFSQTNIKINMMQVSALSFSACFDDDESKFNQLKNLLEANFSYKYNNHLQLITIRHATEDSIKTYAQAKSLLLEQRSRTTAQFILKNDE
ncbi:aspartate kinase [Pedobacter glucosidilyticus]|uniref:aspartate kinase n=1 Tax=Pedobacter glucosidilyticus TaxID=1122941 RepID=UPI0026F2AB6F|nr:aspartate kinase [Pedobacter glucosidilyticus]